MLKHVIVNYFEEMHIEHKSQILSGSIQQVNYHSQFLKSVLSNGRFPVIHKDEHQTKDIQNE